MILGVPNRKEICEFAYNGQQALEKIKESVQNNDPHKYSLILMDCNMPFMDGYEATKKIRRLYNQRKMATENQPKIIAITGHIENEYVDRALASGMDKILQKPLHIREFGQLLMDMRYITKVPSHL